MVGLSATRETVRVLRSACYIYGAKKNRCEDGPVGADGEVSTKVPRGNVLWLQLAIDVMMRKGRDRMYVSVRRYILLLSIVFLSR